MPGLATLEIFWQVGLEAPLDSTVDTSAIKVILCLKVSAGGLQIDVALPSIGISDEQLGRNIV